MFAIGAVAICGLPPLNGFISEFLVFAGALVGAVNYGGATAISGLVVILSLALILQSESFGIESIDTM